MLLSPPPPTGLQLLVLGLLVRQFLMRYYSSTTGSRANLSHQPAAGRSCHNLLGTELNRQCRMSNINTMVEHSNRASRALDLALELILNIDIIEILYQAV